MKVVTGLINVALKVSVESDNTQVREIVFPFSTVLLIFPYIGLSFVKAKDH